MIINLRKGDSFALIVRNKDVISAFFDLQQSTMRLKLNHGNINKTNACLVEWLLIPEKHTCVCSAQKLCLQHQIEFTRGSFFCLPELKLEE